MTDFVTKDSGERVDYPSGMRRDTQAGKPRYSLLKPVLPMLKRYVELLTRGAEKYGDSNWTLANSQEELDRFKDSAFRHFMQWFNGETDEDHASATTFNMWAAETVEAKLAEPDEEPLADWEIELRAELRADLGDETKPVTVHNHVEGGRCSVTCPAAAEAWSTAYRHEYPKGEVLGW